MAFNPNKTDREAIRAKMTQALRDNDAEAYAAASLVNVRTSIELISASDSLSHRSSIIL